jgi:1-acyl-sn-glycerol-3-phosphate acyltransferase
VSYNLRHGGSALIDRKIPNKPFLKSKKLGDYIEEHNQQFIFPEGTK